MYTGNFLRKKRMHVLLTTPGMHMCAVFGATICRANNAIIYAHDSGWIFKNIFGNLRLSIPDPSLAFISKMQAELETRFSNETVARVIVIKWLSFYLMKTIKVKCLLRWAFKVTYYATLLRTNIRRKQVSVQRMMALRALSVRIPEVGIREKIIRLARFW